MKYISYHILLLCILLLVLSQCISSCSCFGCDSGPYISEITHYISEVHKIKSTNLILKDHDPIYTDNHHYYESMVSYLNTKEVSVERHINSNDYYLFKFPYRDKDNTIKYIQNSLIIKTGGWFSLPYKRSFYSGFSFVFAPNTEILAIDIPSVRQRKWEWENANLYFSGAVENYVNFESYYYISTAEPNNGYNLKEYYLKDKTYIPIIEDFYKSVKDTFNLTKIKATATGGPVYPCNIVLLDTIKAINIYCNNDYNDKYKKGSLLNDIMKIVYFNHRPFLQQWHQKSIEDNGATITVSDSDNILFATDFNYSNYGYGNDNYTEEWLEEFNAKANTDRLLLHPEILLLGTENPAEQGEYSFTIEFVYNTGKKIVQKTPNFVLLQEFYPND